MLQSSSIIFVVLRRFASGLVYWSRNSEGGAVFVGQKMIALKFANDVVAVVIRNKGVTVSGSCSDRWEDT